MLPLFGPFFGLGIGLSLLLLFIALLAAVLGQLAIGRAGEYAADECGARLSGRPDALAAALRLASTDDAEFDDVANSQVAIALLAIGKRLAGPRRDNSFSAYPLPANRIAALDQLSREMGSGGHGAVCNEPTRGELLRLLPGFRSRIDRNKRFDAVTA